MNELKKQYMRPQLERNYKKFFTPEHVADLMVRLVIPLPWNTILEPSAGNGSIVKAIKRFEPDAIVYACELKEQHREDLLKAGAKTCIGDFLEYPESLMFNHCIANPPFGNETDIKDHFDKICRLVRPGGKVVMIVPKDFNPGKPHSAHPIDNWSTNSDGTTTPIKILEFVQIRNINPLFIVSV